MKKELVRLVFRLTFLSICLVGGFVGLSIAKNRIDQYNREGAILARQIYEMETLLSSKDDWEKRSRWVNQQIPRFAGLDAASNHLLEMLQNSAKTHQLTFESHQSIEPTTVELVRMEENNHFKHVEMMVKVIGVEKDIVSWIHELQDPNHFTGINEVEMELADYGLVCQLKICQWFKDEYPVRSLYSGGSSNLASSP